MPRKVQERGLYLRESLERTSDLLLMEESFVYTLLLRSPHYASATLHLFFPPSICVLRRLAPPPPPFAPIAHFSFLQLKPPFLAPLLLQSLALFDWTLSQDLPKPRTG